MAKVTFKIQTKHGEVEVTGSIIRIKNLPEHKFEVHPGVDINLQPVKGTYCVSHIDSGASICGPFYERWQADVAAEIRLGELTNEAFINLLKKPLFYSDSN